MNYIYDIVLNFQDNYYQFFEWNRKDKIKNITRIPVYRVTDQDLNVFKNNQVKINSTFLNKIKEDNRKYKKMMCLVTNTKLTIGLLFDNDGTLLKRSSLLFEEEDEVNHFGMTLDITKIEYLENIERIPKNKLRIELEKKDTLIHYITKNSDEIILKYLYYEYFQEECTKTEEIKKILTKELEKNWTKKQNNLYYLVTLLNKNNLPIK